MSNIAVNLDKYDRRILYELDVNGRETIKNIAKKLGKGKEFVEYRIKRMKQKGIYEGDFLVLDTSKLGLSTYTLYLQVSDSKYVQKIADFLRLKPQVWGLDRIIGQYQLYTRLYVRHVEEVEKLLELISQKYGKVVMKHRLLQVYESVSLAHNYLFTERRFVHHDKVRFASKAINLNAKEIRMLQVLYQTPRASLNKIATSIGCSFARTKALYNRLVEEEVILYIRPSVESHKLHYLHRHITLKLKFSGRSHLREISCYLRSLRAARIIYHTLGAYDLTGRFVFSSLEEFNHFNEELYSKFGNYIESLHNDDYYENISSTNESSVKYLGSCSD